MMTIAGYHSLQGASVTLSLSVVPSSCLPLRTLGLVYVADIAIMQADSYAGRLG